MNHAVGLYRIAHFKEDDSSGGYNYSTGWSLVLTGLGSTSSSLKGRIENKDSRIHSHV